MDYPSQNIETLVEEMSRLPGIGRKTALRLALHLLKCPQSQLDNLGAAVMDLRKGLQHCAKCHNLTEHEICAICANPNRKPQTICVVEDIQDLIAIEKTGRFDGVYHLLGGVINPMAGIGPAQLNIESLVSRVHTEHSSEVILALNSTVEGETTAFYIARRLAPTGVRVTGIARGIPMGSALEFTDEMTLARSLQQRVEISAPDPAH